MNNDEVLENTINNDASRELSQSCRIEKRVASISADYGVFVASRSFLSYLENDTSRCMQITDFIHPEELQDFCAFLKNEAETNGRKIFRMKKSNGEWRFNLIKVYAEKGGLSDKQNWGIECIDIEDAVRINEMAVLDELKTRAVLGLTDEYMFSYNRSTNMFLMFHYKGYQRVIVYKMDLDQWRKKMLDEGYIREEEKAMFATFVADLRSYAQNFSVKLNCAVRTQSEIKEPLKFVGMVHNGGDNDKTVIGRIIPDVSAGQANSALEIMGELQYDSLTGTYNKKTIVEIAEKKIREEKQNKIVIAILDVDHFKKVNDTYGHLYGDKVLARVGARLMDIVGDDGIVGRIGGDEFMLILMGMDDDQTLRGMLRAIRTQIKWEFVDEFDDFIISCSIGAAIFPSNGRTYEDLFKKADYCLYIAKEKGRDRYVFFRDELHAEAYEKSIGVHKNASASNSREVRELRYVSKFMQDVILDRKNALTSAFNHICTAFKVDNITLYYGDKLQKVYSFGLPLNDDGDAGYINSSECDVLLDGGKVFAEGFVSRLSSSAPKFVEIMKQRGIISTVHCIIGNESVKGVAIFNRCENGSQWADYEIESIVILCSYLTMMDETVGIPAIVKELSEINCI